MAHQAASPTADPNAIYDFVTQSTKTTPVFAGFLIAFLFFLYIIGVA